ncbi:hypothetical protein PS639_05650 [Pseudomonas fluorescens]|nr:hypothetical protein PS639_05650 [Pseudomonas fluorescens]
MVVEGVGRMPEGGGKQDSFVTAPEKFCNALGVVEFSLNPRNDKALKNQGFVV